VPKSLWLLAGVWIALVGTVVLAQRGPTTISVDDIRPGMRGYGLTVFRGTQPERFDVEVIDVLHRFLPNQDLILVRTDHPILDHASTVAGMSGSPIYIENRLAGAYAYGWPFGKDPVAGVTPIASMLAEIDRPVRPDAFFGADVFSTKRPAKQARSEPSPRLSGLSPYWGTRDRSALDPLRELAARVGVGVGARGSSAGPQGLAVASTPIMLGGMTDSVVRMLDEQLSPFGLTALQAGGSQAPQRGSAQAVRPRFVDGGAVGVQLIRGDMSATGIGTVTQVMGNRLVAFGHPMMNAGEIGLPTCTARVLHVLASEQRSFKIAEALEPVGTLIHDRQAAIVVDANHDATTVPVSITITGVDGAPRTRWNVEVASHRVLTPMLTLAAMANVVSATASDQTDVTFTARTTAQIPGHGSVELEDQGFMLRGPNDPSALGGIRLFQLMEAAYGNPFEPGRVQSVDIQLHVRFERDVYRIIDASVGADEVDPGSRIELHVLLQRYDDTEEVRIVPVDIPEAAAGATVQLQVLAADDVVLERPEPRSLGDLIAIIRNRYPATSIAVSLRMPSRGMRFRGHVVRSLPDSALGTLQLTNDTNRGESFETQVRQVTPFGHLLTGSAQLTLRVRQVPRP